MGLAASQARLLMLTGRKDDVESGLMALANQKLSLARKSANISQDYSNALNATKLVWNNGTGSDDDVALTYGLLMKYNESNTEGQYMLADNYGRAVLNDTYANMLCGEGVDSVSASGLAMSDTSFLQSMMSVDSATASKYIVKYAHDTTATAGNSYNGDIGYTDDAIEGNLFDEGATYTSGDGATHTYNSNINASSVVIYSTSSDLTDREDDIRALVNQITGDVGKSLVEVTDIDSSALKAALDAATVSTQNHYLNSVDKCMSEKYMSSHSGYGTGAAGHADGSNQTFTARNTQNSYADVSQMIKTFLSYFDQACGITNSGYVGEMANSDKNTGTAHNTYTSRTGVTDKATVTEAKDETFTKASFYLAMYYFAQKNGATRSSSIDKNNGAYLQNQIQSGNIHLCKYASDGVWDAVSTSDEESIISSQSDEDQITAAETKYNAEKDELDYKESQIDLQITNLDTERSALDTEVDSVKTILNKNIERSFKLFQNA